MLAIILLSLFMLVMIGIGIWGMRKTSTLSDFFLGGRTIGPWISAFAYGTAYFSAVVFIGFAGKLGWGFGMQTLWIAAGNAVFGALLAWLVLGRRTRRMTQNLNVMTMPEFLHERFNAKYTKLITAAVIFIFLVPYSASVFKGLGHMFEVNFGMSYDMALLMMIGITGVYLVLGGYFALTLTDFIQGLIMIVGSLAMIAVIAGNGGGLSTIIQTVTENYPQHVPAAKQPSTLLLVCLVFMTSFGPWGLPQMVQKYYAIKDESMILKGAIVSFVFATIIGFAAYFVGACSHAFFAAPPMVEGKPALDLLVPQLLQSQLPSLLMAIILLLVLSASMSTLSSLVLVSASSVAIDMYKGHVNPQVSKKNSLAMMRFLSGVFIALSYFIAKFKFAIIVTLMSLSWGAVAGSFMAPFLYSLYWKGTTRIGAGAGMVTGLVLAVTLFFVMGPANSPIASTIAMIVPFFVVPVVSKLTRTPDQQLIDQAFEGI